jgi:hypothetical protein
MYEFVQNWADPYAIGAANQQSRFVITSYAREGNVQGSWLESSDTADNLRRYFANWMRPDALPFTDRQVNK